MRHAFTMIELVFVIVILGILAAIAIPKFAATRDDAKVVTLAQQIMTGAQDISMYATAQAKTENDLTKMSNTLASLKNQGLLTVNTANKSVDVKAGSVNNCVTLKIVTGISDDNLTITFNSTGGDVLCVQLQKVIPAAAYPMRLRGTHVQY